MFNFDAVFHPSVTGTDATLHSDGVTYHIMGVVDVWGCGVVASAITEGSSDVRVSYHSWHLERGYQSMDKVA